MPVEELQKRSKSTQKKKGTFWVFFLGFNYPRLKRKKMMLCDEKYEREKKKKHQKKKRNKLIYFIIVSKKKKKVLKIFKEQLPRFALFHKD